MSKLGCLFKQHPFALGSRASHRKRPRLARARPAMAIAAQSSNLISAEALQARMQAPEGDAPLAVLDASWHMPATKRDPRQEFAASRIPGSRFFDVDGVSAASSLPHMLPSEAGFSAAMDALGVTQDSFVVVYDRVGIFSAPRLWWTLRAFGHRRDLVRVLDGGFGAWVDGGFPLDQTPLPPEDLLGPTEACRQPPAITRYPAKLQAGSVVDMAQVRAVSEGRAAGTLLDARPAGRFNGTAPEPRPGLRSGHIPGALSVPFTEVLEDGRFLKGAGELRGVLPPVEGRVIASCGTGVTACIVGLALAEAAPEADVAVYDGRVLNYFVNQLLVDSLANSRSFQKFAVRADALGKELSQSGVKQQERAAQFAKTFREELKKGLKGLEDQRRR